MGEFADQAVNEAMDMEDLQLGYRLGRIGTAEAFDARLIDELGADIPASAAKTCRHCGAGGLGWTETAAGWRLATGAGEIHVCTQYEASAPL